MQNAVTSSQQLPDASVSDPALPGAIETRQLQVGGVELLVLSFAAVPAKLPADLSAAEREVLCGLLQGETNAQVAARRQTAVRTAANQVASIFRKIGVTSRAELAARLCL